MATFAACWRSGSARELSAEQGRELGGGEHHRVAALSNEPVHGVATLLSGQIGDDAIHQLSVDDPVHRERLFAGGNVDVDSARSQPARVEIALHQGSGTEDADTAVSGGPRLVGHDLCDMQARKVESHPGPFQREMRRVVRADEERRAGGGESPGAAGELGADGALVPGPPRGETMPEPDVVEGDVRVGVAAESPGSLSAAREETDRRPVRVGAEDSDVGHG